MNNLPSVNAVDAACEAAYLWDQGWSISAVKFGKTVYQCSENNGVIFVRDVLTGRCTQQSTKDTPGNNSIMALANCLDELSEPRELDFIMAYEAMGITSINHIITMEQASDFAASMINMGWAATLDPLAFGVYVSSVVYGFPSNEAYEFSRMLVYSSKQDLYSQILDKISEFHFIKSNECRG